VGVRRARERELGADPHVEPARGDRVEDRARAQLELGAVLRVVRERRTRDEERPHRVEPAEIERRHRTRRLAEQHEQAARAQRREAAVERRLADRVVHDVGAATLRPFAQRRREIALRVADHVIGAGLARERFLLGGRTGADHRRTGGLEQLYEQKPGAAGGRVHEREVAALRVAHAVHQVVRGHALQHRGGRDRIGDAVGHAHEARRGREHAARVRPGHRPPRHAIARREAAHVGADRVDLARALEPGDERHRPRIEPGAEVHVDVVHADRAHADAHLTRPRIAELALVEREDLGSSGRSHGDRRDLHEASGSAGSA
jgi:hypothetical protein